MKVSCSQCSKTFANKYSLASHKSRYHNKSQRKPEKTTTTKHYSDVSADDHNDQLSTSGGDVENVDNSSYNANAESDENVSDGELQNHSKDNNAMSSRGSDLSRFLKPNFAAPR